MTKTLNHIIFFFLQHNQNIFFSNIGNQNIFLEKNHIPPLQVKWSFPNVIDSWNLLDVDTQNQHSRLMFKKQIRSNTSVPPPYFALGTRKYNICHCQLRTLQLVTWINTSSCHTCHMVQGVLVGMMLKTTFTTFMSVHFSFAKDFLLFTQLRDLAYFLNIDVLLKGSPDLSFDDNVLIINSVHTFICGTKRLDYIILTFFNLILYYLLWNLF
jgi:hypothetical protein